MTLVALFIGCGLLNSGTIEETCEDLPGGCGGAGDGGTATVDPIDIAVDAVEPVYGLTDGGDSVIVRGGPFAADAEVLFDGQPAQLRTWLETELRVLTPAVTAEGWVEISVTTSVGEGRKAEAFRYFQDASDETAMLGMVERIHQTGALASLGDEGFAQIGFISPEADASWFDTISDGWDSCRRDWEPELGWTPLDPGADALELSTASGTYSLSLAWDSVEQLYNGTDGTGAVPADQVVPGTRWNLSTFGGEALPDFSLGTVLELPDELELSSPDLDSSSLTLASDELDFRWAADTNSDGIYIELLLVDGSSGSQLQSVTCLATDDGAFTVPATALDSWESGKTLYIKLGRAVETWAVLPLNGADTRLIGGYAVVGAATTE